MIGVSSAWVVSPATVASAAMAASSSGRASDQVGAAASSVSPAFNIRRGRWRRQPGRATGATPAGASAFGWRMLHPANVAASESADWIGLANAGSGGLLGRVAFGLAIYATFRIPSATALVCARAALPRQPAPAAVASRRRSDHILVRRRRRRRLEVDRGSIGRLRRRRFRREVSTRLMVRMHPTSAADRLGRSRCSRVGFRRRDLEEVTCARRRLAWRRRERAGLALHHGEPAPCLREQRAQTLR